MTVVALAHPLAEVLAESAFLPIEFGTGVRIIVWWTVLCCLSLGGYFIFLAEKKLPLLGFSMGLLGVFLYFVIFRPAYLPVRLTLDILLGSTLFLFNVVGAYVMPIVFRYEGLDPPWVRVPALMREKCAQFNYYCSKLR